MQYEKKRLIIDCDPGIDDALALTFAMARPEFEILGITAVGGNAPIETTLHNALRLAELAGRTEIPVLRGLSPSQSAAFQSDGSCHGADGLGNSNLPPAVKQPGKGSAEDFIIQTLLNHETGSITIVSTGPLTNLAAAMKKNPDAMGRAKEIFSMGGAYLHGNITAVAEFNYWMDPAAAETVFSGNVPVYMVGLNTTEQVVLTKAHAEQMQKSESAVARALAAMLPTQFAFCEQIDSRNGMTPHDLVAMAACLNPQLIRWVPCSVQISTTKVTRGECIIDMVDAWKLPKNCFVATDIDADEFFKLFFHTMLPDMM